MALHLPQKQWISIHAPHEGERRMAYRFAQNAAKFQSTLPTRGSDFGACLREGGINQYFNPRSPRGGATRFIRYIWSNIIISIHAPHEGERPRNKIAAAPLRQFQSTLPTRGSDAVHAVAYGRPQNISIHAPHEGERPIVDLGNNYATTISIHAPHEGERLINGFRSRAERPFQSTLPTRGSDRYIIQSISS